MNKRASILINKLEMSQQRAAEFVAATRVTRAAFITTIRDIADSRAETKAILPKGPHTLQPHDAWLVRSYVELMLKGAGALAIGLRTEEAQAVIAAADLIVELSRSEELRAEMAQAFNDHERMIAEVHRDLKDLGEAERRALRKLLKAIDEGAA